MKKYLSLLLGLLLLLGCAVPAFAEGAAATAAQMSTVSEVVEPGMQPVYAKDLAEGEYPVEFKCSSSMFRIESALLRVKEGKMEAVLTMGSESFLYVYPGKAETAASAEEEGWITPERSESGAMTFTIPVQALDEPVACAAFSRNKELWYDRDLLFRADSLPMAAFRQDFFTTAESLKLADGNYTCEVSLAGGSGRAKVENPVKLNVRDGSCTATVIWGSKNYDYMQIGGCRYDPVNSEGNAAFCIPVSYFDRPMAVEADTVAMSEPHLIRYTLLFDSGSLERTA